MTPSPSSVAPVVAEPDTTFTLCFKSGRIAFERISTTETEWSLPGTYKALIGVMKEMAADYHRLLLKECQSGHLAALASAQGEGSMETAPKGQDVLLYSERNREWFIGDWGRYDIYNHPRISRWRPLPPIPATSPAKDQA